MKKLFNVALGAAIVAGALLLTTANVGKASAADNGNTTLSGAACSTLPSAQAYNIDFGTFLATDVYGTIKYNGGTKGVGGAGSQRTPTNGSGGADYYAYITNPCAKTGWTLTVDATDMAATGYTAIPDDSLYFSGANGYFRFNNSPANPQVTYTSYGNTTLDSASTVLTHGGTYNAIAGDYGVLLTHTIAIPANSVPVLYQGNFVVTCVGNCS